MKKNYNFDRPYRPLSAFNWICFLWIGNKIGLIYIVKYFFRLGHPINLKPGRVTPCLRHKIWKRRTHIRGRGCGSPTNPQSQDDNKKCVRLSIRLQNTWNLLCWRKSRHISDLTIFSMFAAGGSASLVMRLWSSTVWDIESPQRNKFPNKRIRVSCIISFGWLLTGDECFARCRQLNF